LIVDEVLAVGDAEFQKKCMGKMGDISKSGRTILFVSHNIESVAVLCTKGILLDAGKVQTSGNVQDVIYKYTNHYQDSFKEWLPQDRPGDNIVKLNKVSVIDSEKNQIFQPETGQTFGVCIEFEVLENNVKPAPNFHFYDSTGVYCFITITDVEELSKGNYRTITWVPSNFLNNRIYSVGVALTTLKTEHVHLYAKEIINIEIIENKSLRNHEYGGQIPGIIRPDFKSQTIKIN
jgi:lipopolysaccharide transport system ATP-binding protein